MGEIKNRIRLHLIFWKSTLNISIPITIGVALLGVHVITPSFFLILLHILYFLPVGLFLSLLYKELSHKEEYYFYHNRGITRLELWTVSFLLSASFYVIGKLIEIIWNISWK